MIIKINETKKCWICGKETISLTLHHALPKHLKPINNIILPICDKCHKKINVQDIKGMYAFLFKIKKEMETNGNMLNKALERLFKLGEIKRATNEKRTSN